MQHVTRFKQGSHKTCLETRTVVRGKYEAGFLIVLVIASVHQDRNVAVNICSNDDERASTAWGNLVTVCCFAREKKAKKKQ